MTKIIRVIGKPIKTNSSYGNYAIPCEVQHSYAPTKIMQEFQYFWTLKAANELSNKGGIK